MLRQCATSAIAAVHAASIMFAMAATLGRLVAQLKMPRLDAYGASLTRTLGRTNRLGLRLIRSKCSLSQASLEAVALARMRGTLLLEEHPCPILTDRNQQWGRSADSFDYNE